MMMDSVTFRDSLENATISEIIKERENLIMEIRRCGKGKIPEEDYCMSPSPETVYMMNNLYLAELCSLIYEKHMETDEYY